MNRRTVLLAVKTCGLALSAVLLVGVGVLWHAPARAQADAEVAYVGAGVGQGSYKWRNSPSGGTDVCGFAFQINCEDSPIGLKAFVGYNINGYLGIEGGYYNAGTVTLQQSIPGLGTLERKLTLNGFSVSVVGTLPLGTAFVSGRAGIAAATASRKDEFQGSSQLVERTKSQPILGVGAGVKVWRWLVVRLDWDRVRGQTTANEKFEADLVTLNVMYRFE